MTKFINLNNKPKKVEKKKTTFTKVVNQDNIGNNRIFKPTDFDTVVFIGHDKNYGDVFKAYDDDDDDIFILYFGVKGDEFEDNIE